MSTLLQTVESLVASAVGSAFPDAAGTEPQVTPATDPKFGDYQSNVAMGLGKRTGTKPRDVAAAITKALDGSPAASAVLLPAEIAGPGFINMRLRPEWVAARLAATARDERLGVARVEAPRRYVVDFSSPNVAKPMHVGHIRSTIIGDCLAKLLRFAGHTVITDNHLGDWGTQFGMLIVGHRRFVDTARLDAAPIEELVTLYKMVSGLGRGAEVFLAELARDAADPTKTFEARADAAALRARVVAAVGEHPPHPPELHGQHLMDEARAELVKLQAGDPDNLALWKSFVELSLREFDAVYRRLNVRFDHVLGESFYNEMLPGVLTDLKARGIARESEGAWCAFPQGPGIPDSPFIVQKRDGAFNYATTDLATIRYRADHFHADAALYVVGTPQADHFRQLFATAKMWGYGKMDLRHIDFGSVLGPDGKLLRTRSGSSVRLTDLLDEAEERATKIVDGLRPDLPAEERCRIGAAVGVAAVKYADLMQNRSSDYKYSVEKMVALDGNTAPYLMMQYVRCRAIFRKAGTTPEAVAATGEAPSVEHASEQALARHVLRLPDAIRNTLADFRPNLLCAYLYELSEKYAAFFRDCQVVTSPEPLRTRRLAMCDVTARTLALGLGLLGIPVLEQM